MGKLAWTVLCGLSCFSCVQHSASWSGNDVEIHKALGRSLLGFLPSPSLRVQTGSLHPSQKRVAVNRACRRFKTSKQQVVGLRMLEGGAGSENRTEPWNLDTVDDNDASSLNQYATYGEENGFQTSESDGGAFRVPQKKTGEGWMIGKAPAAPALDEEDMTEELKERVLAVMIDAFDNLPPFEVERKLELIWEQGPDAGPNQNTLRSLVALTGEVEGIAKASRDRWSTPGAQFEDLLSALQVARSRVRMYGKDAEYYDPDSFVSWMNPDRNPRVQPQEKGGFKWPWQAD